MPVRPTSNPDHVFEELWHRRLEDATSLVYVPGRNLRIDCAARMLQPGSRLLDVGCGSGMLAIAVRGKFEQVYGVDIAESAVAAACRQGVAATRVDLSRDPLPFDSGFFGAVTLLAVLPYVYDPRRTLDECHRVLRDGGQFVLSVANMRTIGKFFRLFIRGRFPTTSKLNSSACDGGAMHYFCSRDLEDLLRSTGFEVTARKGIFCRPRFLERFPDTFPVLGNLKSEFFGGEVLLVARKSIAPGLVHA